MTDKEKYRARIEARLMKFGESLYEITTKKEQRKANLPEIEIEPILRKHEAAEGKLKELVEANESNWQNHMTELDRLVDDIDQDLRKAMAYFG